jgi:TetR/AcrR family tetracycline transcriptional repressor
MLSRAALIERALAIADREGLEQVSLRRLAHEFKVTPMALYHHVQDKAALLSGMVDQVLSQVAAPKPGTQSSWVGELRGLLRSFVRVRKRHPCAADLVRSPVPSKEADRLTGTTLGLLRRAGFPPRVAFAILRQCSTLLTQRSSGEEDPSLAVELLVLGTQGLLRRQKKTRKPLAPKPRGKT